MREQALIDEREAFKLKWQEIGFEWSEDALYPSCSDPSSSESGGDDVSPHRIFKKDDSSSASVSAADSIVSSVGNVSASSRCNAAHPDRQVERTRRLPERLSVIKPERSNRSTTPAKSAIVKSLLCSTDSLLDRATASDLQLAKTICHHMCKLHRDVGKDDSLCSTLLQRAAEEQNCHFLLRLLEANFRIVNKPPVAGALVSQHSEHVESDDASSPPCKKVLRHKKKPSRVVGWPDEDLRQ
jgi:hypothetical protein